MRNIFLSLTLFLFFIISTNVNAGFNYGATNQERLTAANWTQEQIQAIDANVNNVSSGSWFNDNQATSVTVNLYDNGSKGVSLTSVERRGVINKLTEGGSTFNTNLISQNTSIYRINTGETSTYIYDPTPENKTNGDEVALGTATKGGSFLVYKTPVAKEVAGRTDQQNISARDATSLDGILNAIDVANGRPIGTSVSQKNKIDNLIQERIDLAPAIEEAEAAYREALEARRNYEQSENRNPSILETLKEEEALRKRQLDALKQTQGQIDTDIANERARAQALRENSGPELGDKCVGVVNTFTNSYYCLTVTIAKLTNIIFKLVSFVAFITGTLFDFSLEFSINSAEFFKKIGVIETVWSFIRDVLNMSFIFILLFTAIQILIGNENKYNAQKMLRNVIIVAILMNFSLFAAKFMVDMSNIASLKIYEAMKATDQANKGSSISVRVMNTVGLTPLYDIGQIFNVNKIQAEGTCATNPGSLITISVMGSIFLIVLSLALGLAAILFLVRLVNIVFLLIKSPLWVWGHVIPGNKRVEDFKTKWWSQMMHVLTFPIAYLFWMFVALIVFTKIGGGGETLVSLICGNPQNSDVAGSISVVAIFIIVIIFMMKAIEYGVKHAGDGGEDSIGSGFATSMAKRFQGYQTAVTTGLMKKAGGAALAAGSMASVGAGRQAIKLTTGAAEGLSSARKGNSFLRGFGDGYSNSSITTKEALRDAARGLVAKTEGGIFDKMGITSLAAKTAAKYDDPKNSAGETKKEIEAKRAKKAAEDEANRYKALDKHFKIKTQKEWEKETSGTTDEYKTYLEDIIKKRADSMIGSGAMNMTGTNGKTHLENLRKASIEEYDEDQKDASGAVIGTIKKIRFKEADMHKALQDVLNHETTAKEITNGKKKFTVYRNIKAKARLKAIESNISKSKSNALTKDSKKKQIELLEKAISKMQEIKSKTNKTELERLMRDGFEYSGVGENEKTIIEFNKIMYKLQGETDTVKQNELKDQLKKVIAKHEEFINSYDEKLVKKQNDLVSKIKALEEENKNK